MSNLDSTNKLTEFPPLEAEEKSDAKFSFSKLMFWKKSDSVKQDPEVPAGPVPSAPSSGSGSLVSNPDISLPGSDKKTFLEPDNMSLPHQSQHQLRKSPLPAYYRSDSNLSNLSNPSPDPMDGSVSPFFEARTLPNVLRRISSLIAMGTNNQSDIKKYWMPDSVSKECYECAEKFTTFRRKHHCRICGQIFCSRCCNQEIPGKIIGYSGDLRVCTYCCRIVLSYLQSADLSTNLTDDLRVVQEDLQNRFGGPSGENLLTHGSSSNYSSLTAEHPTHYRSLPRRKASLGYQEEKFANSRSKVENAFDIPATGGAPEDKMKSFGDWVNLKALWDEMCHPVTGIDWATHRHNMMKNFHSCVVGSELVDWLLAQRKVTWRGQGIQVGQMLVDANLIECVSQTEQIFLDAYALYRPIQLPLPIVEETTEAISTRSSSDYGDGIEWSTAVQDPLWVKQIKNPNINKIDEGNESGNANDGKDSTEAVKSRLPSAVSLYSLDLNLCDSTVSISKPKESTLDALDPYTNCQAQPGASPNSSVRTTPRNPRKISTMSVTTETMTDEFLQKTLLSQKERGKEFSAPTGWHSPQQLTSDGELLAFQLLCNAYIRHENDFLMQLLESMHLSPSWADIILPIVHKVTEIVRPDVRHADDDMDIRQYIQFKKVPGGTKENCRIVNGVVCTKNIAHRNMRSKFKDPKILLIGSSIDYQRFENRFLSLEPLVMQEYDYLKNTVARIASLTPDLVLVEKTVSRLAQEFMLEQGITLVINVKSSVMERVARSSQAVIISSADTHIGRPQLGLCHNFYLETFRISEGVNKTLMFFDGCAMHLGCTVILRGGHSAELMKVKKIISLMMFVAYNWRLERSFHIDLFSMPPEPMVEKPGINILDSPESDEFVLAREELTSPDSDPGGKKQIEEKLSPADKRTSVKTELCDDFSDPLHSYLVCGSPAVQDTENGEKLIVEYLPDSSKYSLKKCLDEVILSASPFIKYTLPYLETDSGKACELRKYFPEEIYWSTLLYRASSLGSLSTQHCSDMDNNSTINPGGAHGYLGINNVVLDIPRIEWKPPHPFSSTKLTSAVGSDEIQALVADFRRKGGRLDFTSHSKCTLTPAKRMRSNNSSWNTLENERIRSIDGQGRVDALDPFKHQKLAVLFCSYSPISNNAPYFCVNPWVVYMDLYGRNDISLGMFLERYCFRKSYLCPARQCDTSMLHHIRRFAHEDGCVQVLLKELASPILGSGENILMWNWCSYCRTVSPIVPISVDAWSLSFAKYLELRFHGKMYTRRGFDHPCNHSLHHDHQHYFAQHNIVASFKYYKVKLWEIYLPPNFIHIKTDVKPKPQLIEDVKTMAVTGHGVYGNILDILTSLKESSTGLRAEEVSSALLEHLKAERNSFRSKIEDIQVNLSSLSSCENKANNDGDEFHWKVTDSLEFLKSNVADTIQSWNNRLNDFLALRKREEKQAKGTAKVEAESSEIMSQRPPLPRIESDPLFLPSQSAANNTLLLSTKDLEDSFKSTKTGLLDNSTEVKSRDTISLTSSSTVEMSISGVMEDLVPGKSGEDSMSVNKSFHPPSPSHSTRSEVEHHERSKSDGAADKFLRSGIENTEDITDFSRQEKKHNSSATMKTLISHFISGSGAGQLIQSPWAATEHHFSVNLSTIPVTIYESEPSSVVAFTLGSHEYKIKLMEKLPSSKSAEDEDLGSIKKAKYGNDVTEEQTASNSSGKISDSGEDKSTQDIESEDKDRSSKADDHVEVQFSSSAAKFYCRVYFAENFRQLRKFCIAEGEEFYVRAISRCVSWAATGGKSGSTFCKTVDDRFVVKQMSKFEIQSFLDFAPNYFDYMKTAYQEKKPTVLAKIVGVYRIGFKNSQTSSASKMDILIMENLFFERNISQKFDLKGSIRNRLANTSGKEQEDLVLLDENLVNMACENPLYIRPHSKTVLTMALNNDSRFLSSQMVMDYSLLVGLDETKQELVAGIIDYIRTFTWDKRIEAFVKSSGILGGQGKTPTVVSPEEYQTRFCEAMDRYFLLVPDRWMGLGLGVDS